MSYDNDVDDTSDVENDHMTRLMMMRMLILLSMLLMRMLLMMVWHAA
jgi:hypothetical protein